MTISNQPTKADADRLYEQHGKPLEQEHWGKYVAIAPSGQLLLADTLLEAAQRAKATLGPGVFLFKVGERVVGRWR